MSVDLPAPFSPTTACTSPARLSKLTSSSAVTPGKVMVMFRISTRLWTILTSATHPRSGFPPVGRGVTPSADKLTGFTHLRPGRRIGLLEGLGVHLLQDFWHGVHDGIVGEFRVEDRHQVVARDLQPRHPQLRRDGFTAQNVERHLDSLVTLSGREAVGVDRQVVLYPLAQEALEVLAGDRRDRQAGDQKKHTPPST